MGARRKIYIGSHGSSAMTLENVVSENPMRNAAKFAGLFLAGTNEEIDAVKRKLPVDSLGMAAFLEGCSAIVSGYFAGPYLADVKALSLGIGTYMILDAAWRWRPRYDSDGKYESTNSSGILGSVRSAFKGNKTVGNYS